MEERELVLNHHSAKASHLDHDVGFSLHRHLRCVQTLSHYSVALEKFSPKCAQKNRIPITSNNRTRHPMQFKNIWFKNN
jgi:hypothetical protein